MGEYFFADWCSRDLYSLRDNGGGYTLTSYTTKVPSSPTTFGEDINGEVYVGAGSVVYRLDDPTPPVSGCPTTPAANCDAPGKATLVIRDVPPPGANPKDRIIFKSSKGPAESQSGFGTPTNGTDYSWCLYTDTGASPILAAEIGAAGGPGWQALGTKGYKFVDKTAAQDGTTRITLKGDATQPRTRLVWKGKGSALPIPGLPLPQGGDVSVRIHNTANGNCWGADFAPGTTLKNDTKTFKAKLP